jgi:uncharacterized protein YdaU (DUF1376 family)
MNYYEHHLGDYMRDTAHLTILEDGVYRRLIDAYYIKEAPLPADKAKCYKLARASSKAERAAVDAVLEEFFELDVDGFHNKRCDEEIEKFQAKQPEQDEKRENNKERQRRARERRKALFKQLSELGVHMPYNATTGELEAELSRVTSQPVTEPVTRDNTATRHQTPVTRHQSPLLKTSISDALPETLGDSNAPPEDSGQQLSDYGPIAVELISLGVQVTSMHPTLHAWLKDGFTIEQMREAVGIARQNKPAPEKIPANYLDRILRSKPKPPKDSGPPWWATDKGIDDKGRELGMRPRGGESYQEFKARIQAELNKRGGKHGN